MLDDAGISYTSDEEEQQVRGPRRDELWVTPDTRESIETNLEFARRYVDWPYIQHPTPYPGTPMTREFEERGLVVNSRLEEYDGLTTARVKVGTFHRARSPAMMVAIQANIWIPLGIATAMLAVPAAIIALVRAFRGS